MTTPLGISSSSLKACWHELTKAREGASAEAQVAIDVALRHTVLALKQIRLAILHLEGGPQC